MEAKSYSSRSLWRTFLNGNGWAILGIALVTLLVEGGTFLAAMMAWGNIHSATLVTLSVATLWTALAAPSLATGGEDNYSAVLRGGAVIDGGGLVLVTIWLGGLIGDQPGLRFIDGVKIYCVLAATGLAAIAAVCVARRRTARMAMALLAAVALVAMLGSPLWIAGSVVRTDVDQELANFAVGINPFYAVTGACVDRLEFVWHVRGAMYEWSYLGDYVNPQVIPWWYTAAGYFVVAVVLGAVGFLRK